MQNERWPGRIHILVRHSRRKDTIVRLRGNFFGEHPDVADRCDICRSYECADLWGNHTRPAVRMRKSNNPWVHGHAADPFLALLIATLIGAILAGVMLVLR